MDARQRRLERAAAAGDPDAINELFLQRYRDQGQIEFMVNDPEDGRDWYVRIVAPEPGQWADDPLVHFGRITKVTGAPWYGPRRYYSSTVLEAKDHGMFFGEGLGQISHEALREIFPKIMLVRDEVGRVLDHKHVSFGEDFKIDAPGFEFNKDRIWDLCYHRDFPEWTQRSPANACPEGRRLGDLAFRKVSKRRARFGGFPRLKGPRNLRGLTRERFDELAREQKIHPMPKRWWQEKKNPISAVRKPRRLYRSVSPFEMSAILATGRILGRRASFSEDVTQHKTKRSDCVTFWGTKLKDVIHHGEDYLRYFQSLPIVRDAFQATWPVSNLAEELYLKVRDSMGRYRYTQRAVRMALDLTRGLQEGLREAVFAAAAEANDQRGELESTSYVIETKPLSGGTLFTGKDSLSGGRRGRKHNAPEICTADAVGIEDVSAFYLVKDGKVWAEIFDEFDLPFVPTPSFRESQIERAVAAVYKAAPRLAELELALEEAAEKLKRGEDLREPRPLERLLSHASVGIEQGELSEYPAQLTNKARRQGWIEFDRGERLWLLTEAGEEREEALRSEL